MLHATNDLVSLGRGAGLCNILATQRPAKIHKDSVSQCETLIAMRMSHPLDQAAVEDWIGLRRIKKMKKAPADFLERADEIMGGIAFLPDREAYVWAPDPKINVFDQIAFRTYKTFDSGERNVRGATITLTPIDMTALEGKLKQVAEEKAANDPEKLKSEIARLQRQITTQQTAAPIEVDRIVHVADPIATENARALGQKLGSSIGQVDGFFNAMDIVRRVPASGLYAALESEHVNLVAIMNAVKDGVSSSIAAPPPPARAQISRPAAAPQRTMLQGSGPGIAMSKAERLILTALAQYPQGRTKAQVAILCEYAVNGGGFNNALGSLRSKDHIERGEPLMITQSGVTALGSFHPLPHGDALLRHWLEKLGKAERLILEHLATIYPKDSTKEQLGAATNYEPAGGGFNNALGRLRALELISPAGRPLKASDDLFG
jgi:hypothetical protein